MSVSNFKNLTSTTTDSLAQTHSLIPDVNFIEPNFNSCANNFIQLSNAAYDDDDDEDDEIQIPLKIPGSAIMIPKTRGRPPDSAEVKLRKANEKAAKSLLNQNLEKRQKKINLRLFN